MANSYCALHDTYPSANEPCWQCVTKFGDKELWRRFDILSGLVILNEPELWEHYLEDIKNEPIRTSKSPE